MRVIWSKDGATVRDVYEALLDTRSIAYTSVQTMMNVLVKKGHLRRSPGERAHVYTPTRPKGEVVTSMVREFVQRVFDGSARPLLVHLASDEGLTEKERRALQALIAREKKS